MLRCAVCGRRIEPKRHGGGLPRRYCSNACKQRAWKSRHGFPFGEGARDAAQVASILPEVRSRPAEESVAEVLLAVRLVGQVARQVGADSPPQLRWRLSELADSIEESYRRLWPEVSGG